MAYPVSKLNKAQELARAGIVFAPASFLLAVEPHLIEVCNGCGGDGSWIKPPETVYGLDVSAACIIHDFQYSEGGTPEDKIEADQIFLDNMLRIIERNGNSAFKVTQCLRRRRALKYWYAVHLFGGPYFYSK
jgi:hypothetical protein